MLVKKTEWLGLDEKDFGNFINKAQTFWVCVDGLRDTFTLPEDVSRVRFYVYTEPTKKSVELKIGSIPLLGYYEIIVGSERLGLDHHFMSQVTLRKWAKRQRFYYAECEYERFTKHEWEVKKLKMEIHKLELQNEDLRYDINSLRNSVLKCLG